MLNRFFRDVSFVLSPCDVVIPLFVDYVIGVCIAFRRVHAGGCGLGQYRTASDVRGQFQTLLRDAGLIPRDREQLAELNRHSE